MVVAVLAKVAHADARLEEVGTCGSVRERVEKLGTHFFVGANTTIAVAADATETGASGSFAILVNGDPQGRRAMEAASCDALLDDMALAIAMVVSAPPPRVVVEAPPAIVEEDPWELGVLGGAATTASGETSIDLGARVKRGPWSLGLRFVHAIEDDIAVAPGMVKVSRNEIGALACGHLGQLFACGDAAGGWISGDSSGFAKSAAATMPFAAAGLRLGWEQPIVDWLAIQAYVEGRAALTTNRLLIDDMAAWTGSRFEAQLGIAAVAHFP